MYILQYTDIYMYCCIGIYYQSLSSMNKIFSNVKILMFNLISMSIRKIFIQPNIRFYWF